MANARQRDVRAGWTIFYRSSGRVAFEDLNDQLQASGFHPVSSRTYRHFRQLFGAGFVRYVPINRFDVARATDPYDVVASSGRYPFRTSDVAVLAIFAKGTSLLQAAGRAIDVADVGAILAFDDKKTIGGLEKLRPSVGDMLSIEFIEAGQTITGRIAETELSSSPALIEVQYAQLVSLAEIAGGDVLATETAAYSLTPDEGDELTFDLVGKRIFYFFELIEAVRSLVNSAGAAQDVQVYASPPLLDRLSIASPTNIVLELAQTAHQLMPVAYLTASLKAVGALPEKRKAWYEGSAEKQRVEQAKETPQQQQELAELDVALKTAEVELKEAEAASATADAETKQHILAELRRVLPRSQISDEVAMAMVDNTILGAIRNLAEARITEIRQEPSAS